MEKTLTLLLVLSSIIYSQDKIKYDGKELEGKYIGRDSEIIKFHFKGSKTHSEIPFDRQGLDYIILNDGTKITASDIFLTSRILETQEIARADAKQNITILDWFLIGICSGVTGTCGGISMMFLIDDTVPIFIAGGILGAALTGTIFYFKKYNNSKHIHYQYPDLINTEEEKNAMEQNSQFLSDSLSSLKLETNVSEKNMNETYHNAYNNELKRKRKIDLLKFGILSSVSIYVILIYLSDYFDMPLW